MTSTRRAARGRRRAGAWPRAAFVGGAQQQLDRGCRPPGRPPGRRLCAVSWIRRRPRATALTDLVGQRVGDCRSAARSRRTRRRRAVRPCPGCAARVSARPPTSRSIWSPAACPKRSLSSLKPSRSSITRVKRSSARRWRAISCSAVDISSRRLASPVSGSLNAAFASASRSRLRRRAVACRIDRQAAGTSTASQSGGDRVAS